MSQNHKSPVQPAADLGTTACGNCKAPMPFGLRFCRNCGYRLGEGPAEYTPTERFERPTTTDNGEARYDTNYGVSGGPLAPAAGGKMAKRAKKISGMTWMFIGLLVFFISAAIFTAIVTPIRGGDPPQIAAPAPPRSFVGVNSFETVDGGGVTFNNVEPPGGPADKAELVGGDIITSFDGKAIKDKDEITALMRQTPVGKTVEVVYIRDGETRTTKLTTITGEESRRLEREFGNRPEGRGLFGFDDDSTERVRVEGTKIFGVRLNEITQNRPADLAGIKKGDIVIEFGNVPIRTRAEFISRVRRAIPYSTVTVVVMRGNERLEIPVKMGKG